MKRITIFIIAAIISFNLSACGKTKQLLQPDPGIEKQQAGSDTTDYKKLYENECSVSSVRKYIICVLGVAAFVAGIGCLHYIDELIYSRQKLETARSVLKAYDTFHRKDLPSYMTPEMILTKYEGVLRDERALWLVAKPKDRRQIREDFDKDSGVLLNDVRLDTEALQNNANNFFASFNWDDPKPSLTDKLPFRYLRTAGWNCWLKSKNKWKS